jgi:hypothetical protein
MTTGAGIAGGFELLRKQGYTLPPDMAAGLDATVAVWVMLTADLTDAQFIAACASFSQSERAESQWSWPALGQIRALAPGRKNPASNGDVAWAALLELVRLYGRNRPPTLGPAADRIAPDPPPTRQLPGPVDGPVERPLAFIARKRAEIASGSFRSRSPFVALPTWRLAEDSAERAALELGLSALGGWEGLCNLGNDQVGPARASFRAAYERAKADLDQRAREVAVQALLETPRARRLLTKGDRT